MNVRDVVAGSRSQISQFMLDLKAPRVIDHVTLRKVFHDIEAL